MFKNFVFFILSFLLVACGVDTSSSTSLDEVDQNLETNIDNETNSSQGTDENTSSQTNVEEQKDIDSAFDYVDAIEDPLACTTNSGYRVASDASYDGSSLSENGASGFIIQDQGLVLRSEHMSQDNKSTVITLFYKKFPSVENLNIQGVTSYKMEGVFYLSYDIAWSDTSIAGIDNTMYLQSNKNTPPSCYRLKLNSAIGSQIDVQKVYRVRN